MAANDSDISEIVVPDTVETRFGVELEMCVKADALCLNYEGPNVDLATIPFKDKFELFYKNIILKSSSFEYVKDKYTYIGIKSEDGYFVYNMFTPFEADGITVKSEKVPVHSQKIQYFFDYTIPIVMEDCTIVCGDSGSNNERINAGLPLGSKSMNFECISPVLSFTGPSSDDKINTVLHPILVLFGLEKPECIIINYSMGFHVNTSLYDKTEKRYVKIGTQPFLGKALKNYIAEERELYSLVRTMRPKHKANNESYESFWAQPLYKNFNMKKREGPNKSNNNIRNNMTNKSYIGLKQRALKYKSDHLLEFRLFESSSNISTLSFYTAMAIEILHKTYRQMLKAGIEIPLEPKQVNMFSHIKLKQDGGKKYRKTHRRFRKIERKARHTKRRR
jgi:hypothetical protein